MSFSPREIVLASLAALLAAGLLWADTSPRPAEDGYWRDAKGRVIKRLDGDGRLTLYAYSDSGRLARIDFASGRFDATRARGPLVDRVTATHCFEFAEDGRLERETDCVGAVHEFTHPKGGGLDLKTGTALQGHRHVQDGATR